MASAPVRVGALDLLLVEDTMLIRRAVAALLAMAGHRVTEAGDAAAAIAALARGGHDAVLLDIGLPDGSGLDVLATIRRQHGPLPVLLLTAAVDRARIDRIAGDTRTRVLRKPASGAALAAALAELCGTAAEATPPGAPPEYERLKRSARREVRARSIRLARAPDAAAAHQLAGLAAQFGWVDVASAAEALGSTPDAADQLRAAVAAMD
jgi:DNA-binding response OmpR family regulator